MFWKKKKLHFDWKNSISLSTPLEDLTFIVFDTEATGFNIFSKDRMIEIGAVLVNGLTVSEHTFQSYVKPKVNIPEHIVALTGINQEKVENAPEATVAITSFLEFMENNQCVGWVGHGLPFDAALIKRELQRTRHTFNAPTSIDTLDLLHYLRPQQEKKDLEEYAQEFQLPVFQRHTALGDALTTAHLFCNLLIKFQQRGHQTWGDLLHAAESQQRALVFQ